MRNIIAFFGGLVAVLLLAKAMGATPEPKTKTVGYEFRGIVMEYHNRQYVSVADLLTTPFADQDACTDAVKAALSKAKVPPTDYLIGACMNVPKLEQATQT
jgi:hypothetical protein